MLIVLYFHTYISFFLWIKGLNNVDIVPNKLAVSAKDIPGNVTLKSLSFNFCPNYFKLKHIRHLLLIMLAGTVKSIFPLHFHLFAHSRTVTRSSESTWMRIMINHCSNSPTRSAYACQQKSSERGGVWVCVFCGYWLSYFIWTLWGVHVDYTVGLWNAGWSCNFSIPRNGWMRLIWRQY